MKNQRSTQKHKGFALRAVAVVMLMLVAMTCCLAVSVSAATSLTVNASDLQYPNVNGTYTADFGTDANVTEDFAVSADWKQSVAPDADFAIEVASATLADTKIGATTVKITFALTGADAASYTVADVTLPAMIYATDNIPSIGVNNLTFADGKYVNGTYVKTYDGATKTDVLADITLNTAGFALPAGVDIAINSAVLNAATVSQASTLTVSFKLVDKDTTDEVDATENYIAPASITIPAKVTPKTITWDAAEAKINTAINLKYGKSNYDVDFKNLLPALKATDIAAGDTVNILSALNSFNGIDKKQDIVTNVNVVIDNDNYTVAAMEATVKVNPIKLTVDWSSALAAYRWGDKAVNLNTVTAYLDASFAYSASGTPTFQLPVTVWNPDGTAEQTAFKGDVGQYRFQVASPDANVYELNIPYFSFEITPVTYDINMNDITYIGNAANATGENVKVFYLTVGGELPEEVRALITYTCNGKAFNGASDYGVYTVIATLPTSANYTFTKNGAPLTSNEISATMCINRTYIATGSEADKYEVLLVGKDGFSANIAATVTAPNFDRTVLRNYPIHSEFTLTVTGAAGNEGFVVYIPLSEELYMRHVDVPSVDDLYVYEPATNEIVKANTRYTVSIDNGYYKIEGYTASQPITFVIAPHYNVPFFLSAPGIALIILLVVLLIVLMFYIGMKLLRIKASLKDNEPIVIDTVGEEYEGEEVVVDDGEGPPAIDVDALASELESEVEPDDGVDADEVEALTKEAVDVTIQELADEEEAVEEVVEEPVEEVVEEPVEEVVEEVVEEAPEATETIAPVLLSEEEEEDDNDNDDEEEEEDDAGFGAFGPAGLKYIDIQADPEGYAALLEQERQGLITIVYRYRKSYTSRMIQSQGNVQDYYTAIKNRLLSYKGIKDRTSWNYEAFNRGRLHAAKINVKTKTLYLYLALDPAELADTKYTFVDVSSKKKYASVPVLLKIKGDRKFKHALELIDMLGGEKLALKKLEGREEIDYRLPYKTTEELVEEGVVKKLAAGVPVEGAAVAEEAAPAEAPAEEAIAADAPVAEEKTEN